MSGIRVAGYLLVIGVCLELGTGWASAESRKPEERSGITVEDLGRGLKSAVQNIEKEIPKIGSAIGATVKKITGKESASQSPQNPAEGKK